MIILATLAHAQSLQFMLEQTVLHTYPFYYAKGVVDFFISRHNLLAIQEDIMRHQVYVYEKDDEVIGSITIKEDEIYRFFVLPEYQHMGYGMQLLRFAEEQFIEKGIEIRLDASLPSKDLFLSHGYKERAYRKVQLDTGEFYCYDVMIKQQEKNIESQNVRSSKYSFQIMEKSV